MEKKSKCIVVLSGGPDSATVAYWAKEEGYDVHALTFKYGQIASKEVERAKIISQKLGVPHKIIDLSSLREIFMGVTSLCDQSIAMTSTFSDPIIVPFRNAIFLSVAVSYAVSIQAENIFYGAHSSDESFYPDCRKAFYKSLETTARLGTEKEISIEAPFSDVPKSAIIRKGMELKVPFGLTWSCYLEGPKHCGKCESCVNRKRAFYEANITDPTEYEE